MSGRSKGGVRIEGGRGGREEGKFKAAEGEYSVGTVALGENG